MRIVSVVGARPQFVKLAPVARAMEARRAAGEPLEHLIVHTGQHYDAAMSDVFFGQLALPEPSANLEVGSGSHARQTAGMLTGLEDFFRAHAPDAVVVYGDTNSTLAGALAATKLGLPAAHVEAGLRSFDRRMPEEINRIAADHLCDLLLAPTEAAAANLAREGLVRRSRVVGDVMLDAVLQHIAIARSRSNILARLALDGRDYAVATVHRASNTEPEALARLIEGLGGVAARLPVVMPIHPRTRAALKSIRRRIPHALRVIDPVGYLDMLRLVDESALVITDSGGLQKEAFMLGRPCVTLRAETEWTETVAAGANVLVGTDPVALGQAVERWAAAGWVRDGVLSAKAKALYGGGDAAVRVVTELEDLDRSGPSGAS